MASWWTVVLILQFGAFWEFTGATLCTDVTKKTCTKTLQVAGTCTSGVCDCMSGFIPTRTGCSGVVVPKISVFPKLGISSTTYESSPIGSGEVLDGGDIKLTCDPDYGDGLVVWTRNNEPVTGKTNSELELTAIDSTKAGAYRCKIRYTTGDFETATSNPVTISVIADLDTASFLLAPIVVGMPAKAYSGVSIPLKCTNLPSGLALTYDWEEDSIAIVPSATAQTYTVTMSATTRQHRCKITKDSTSPALAIIPAQTQYSAQVQAPTIVTTLTGIFMSNVEPSAYPRAPQNNPPIIPATVTAQSGDTLNVYCVITDTDLIPPTTLTYGWKKGGATVNGQNNVAITTNPLSKSFVTADAGSYTCTLNDGTNPYSSAAVQLNVETTVIEDVDVIAYPASPIIGGYALIHCKVNIDDLRKVTYSWKKEEADIINVTDSTLQINSWAATDDGVYECTARVSLAETLSSQRVTGVALASAAPAVESGVVTEFGVGNKYTLTCGDAYASPGFTYIWYEGTTVVTGQTSQKYEITVKAATDYYCEISFNGAKSAKSTAKTITPKSLLGASIKVGSVSAPVPYKPVTGSSVTLTCIASLAAGASGTPTYAWTKASTTPTILGSSASYTFIAGPTTDDTYTCTVILGTETKTAVVGVANSVTIQTPTISTTADKYGSPEVESFSEGGNYDLTCDTASYNTDLTYVWKKGSNIVGNSRVYQITNANKVSSAGSYVCTVVRGSATSLDSNAKIITIGEKGKPCQYINDCDGDQYDDVCVSNRCVCATGYTLQGNTCSGQGIVTISMLLLVLCGVIKLIM